MSAGMITLKVADADYFQIGMAAVWKRIERGQMPVPLHRRGRRWFCAAQDLAAWRAAGGWGMEFPSMSVPPRRPPVVPDIPD
jgi:hypothetical protein